MIKLLVVFILSTGLWAQDDGVQAYYKGTTTLKSKTYYVNGTKQTLKIERYDLSGTLKAIDYFKHGSLCLVDSFYPTLLITKGQREILLKSKRYHYNNDTCVCEEIHNGLKASNNRHIFGEKCTEIEKACSNNNYDCPTITDCPK